MRLEVLLLLEHAAVRWSRRLAHPHEARHAMSAADPNAMTPAQEGEIIIAGLSLLAGLMPEAESLFRSWAESKRPDLFDAPPDAPSADELSAADAAAVTAKFPAPIGGAT
jgi:hypothetical protein